MRKQSLAVPLTIILGIAANACDDPAQCVDANGTVVDDEQCANANNVDDAGQPLNPGNGHSGFFWYYGGRSFYPGDRASGGSYHPSPGKSYSSPGGYSFSPGVSHGGFGSNGAGHGGGE